MKRILLLFLAIILASACVACQNQSKNITVKYDDSPFINDEESLTYVNNMWRWWNKQTGQVVEEPIRLIDSSKVVPKEQIADMFMESWKGTEEPMTISISYIETKAWYFVSIYSTEDLRGGSEYVVDAMTGTIIVGWDFE
ncbi:MAG: hypothetical protein HN948_08035 [Clostridia bacterium]|mgnify:CR=1 FL=1|jgi:hypothetical protein|nr:hypothetical protein [Clostridia bacterium]MBT7122943.1 hypothetical protein [Clostridia bacterium]